MGAGYDSGVVDILAATSYDSAYRARHLNAQHRATVLTPDREADSKTLYVGVRRQAHHLAGRPREVLSS